MPKQKTHKGTKKRFRLTASGKAKHRQSGTSHLTHEPQAKTRPARNDLPRQHDGKVDSDRARQAQQLVCWQPK